MDNNLPSEKLEVSWLAYSYLKKHIPSTLRSPFHCYMGWVDHFIVVVYI